MPKVTNQPTEHLTLSLINELPKILPAFVTGSRAYGIPEPDSDIDLIVFMSLETYEKVMDFSDSVDQGKSDTMDDRVTCSLKFGNLNIIPVVDVATYQAWKDGTEFLKREAPVDRKRAITVLEEFKRKAYAEGNKQASDKTHS